MAGNPRTAPLAAFTISLALSGAALAHTGVSEPRVKAWMDNMERISQHTKRIGQMARGQAPFDAAAANDALDRIAAHAAEIPGLFKVPALDPKSEARPDIWSDWQRFETEARALAALAGGTEVTSEDSLRAALGGLGAACASCHGSFRD